ncbi:hypothetical protein G9A89_020452 [Geosiphon pyriformis]|nr:hypothetical protein G9A89_020452 [Geosiphon pyriformis]
MSHNNDLLMENPKKIFPTLQDTFRSRSSYLPTNCITLSSPSSISSKSLTSEEVPSIEKEMIDDNYFPYVSSISNISHIYKKQDANTPFTKCLENAKQLRSFAETMHENLKLTNEIFVKLIEENQLLANMSDVLEQKVLVLENEVQVLKQERRHLRKRLETFEGSCDKI